jgi:hypothetical protein
MALDIQQRTAKHGHWRNNTDTETESSLDSTLDPQQKWGDYPCTDVAQQLHAVEKAVLQAKRTLIQDHIDHCLDEAVAGTGNMSGVADFKAITKYL